MARKYNQFGALLGYIKRCFSRSPLHREALENAKCPRKKGPKGGKRYRCAQCKKDFALGSVQVDHIDPVVPVGTPAREMSWDEIVTRLFCPIENLQVLCKKCHEKKSKAENTARKEARKNAAKREG